MVKVPQSTEELKKHLAESLGFLKASCAAFDSGNHSEAKRLATTLRVLLHDTSKSKSLLGLLDLKGQLKFTNTVSPDVPGNLLSYHGLVGLRMGSQGSSYWAPLGDGPPISCQQSPSSFTDWWEQIIINDRVGGVFSRKDLVLTLANRDGGAHVDPKLEPSYAGLTRANSIGWRISDGQTDQALTEIELHSMRQIAYELLQTLSMAGITA